MHAAFHRLIHSPRARVWAAVLIAIAILIARKPWALTTPQLWAEDGSIHLNAVDEFGARALLIPDRGYLHLLPRIAAWVASVIADVAAWPAIYNWTAFAFTALLFARMASPRLVLPGKPWLVLAFVLVAHSGEVFLNMTNLHWLAGFFLVQQALITRPTTAIQRIGDYTLIILAGLSDPCAIIFFPLFLWRWWRERHADNLAVLLVVGACAATQAFFLKTTSPHFAAQDNPLHLLPLLETAASRLIIWPFFGPRLVTWLSPIVQAMIGLGLIAALIAWATRADARRPLRLQLIAAWTLMTFACMYRIRPDSWPVGLDNLSFSEPYFYMPRVLLVWLVIWEFDASSREIAWLARAACIVAVFFQLPAYRVPTPPDYRWAEHCDPIRRGVRADIATLPEGWTLEYWGKRPKR